MSGGQWVQAYRVCADACAARIVGEGEVLQDALGELAQFPERGGLRAGVRWAGLLVGQVAATRECQPGDVLSGLQIETGEVLAGAVLPVLALLYAGQVGAEQAREVAYEVPVELTVPVLTVLTETSVACARETARWASVDGLVVLSAGRARLEFAFR